MLKFFNTWTRKLEEFKPHKKNEVSFYSCGPTVYNYAHIGNLRTYIFADILKRALTYNKQKVKHVLNVTDVGHLTDDGDAGEDKIEKSARMENKSAQEIAEFYWQAFQKDMQHLNILAPDIWAKASEYIQEQIGVIKQLEKKGFTYQITDGVYFDTSKIKDYGKLAMLDLAGLQEGARVGINKEKKNPTDFALWKSSASNGKREQEWESPWGVGFPGWHTECVAMVLKTFPDGLDIHTGGIDHIPVHHTNEIAQFDALKKKNFVKYWLHGEFLILQDQKMAKSKGNFITLQTLLGKGYDPLSFRYLCLTTHYRSKLNFNLHALDAAQTALKKLRDRFVNLGRLSGKVDADYQHKFTECVNNDLNMPQAIALLWDLLKSDLSDPDKRETLLEFDKVFGFDLKNYVKAKQDVPAEILALAEKRQKERLKQNWKKSDALRKELEQKGWLVEDTADGFELKSKDNS